MKNALIILMFSVAFVTPSCAQKSKNETPSEAVKMAFDKKFPDAKSVKWERETDKEWEAEFKMNGQEMSANYDNNGKWLETEIEISKKDLPTKVTAAIAAEFAGFKIEEVDQVSQAEGIKIYEVILEHGDEEWEVLYDTAGNMLGKKLASDEQD